MGFEDPGQWWEGPDPEKALFVQTEVVEICPDGTWPSRKFSTFVQTAVPGLFFRLDCLKLPQTTQHYTGDIRNKHINTLDKVVPMVDRFY